MQDTNDKTKANNLNLKDWLETTNTSQKEFASSIGVASSTISRIISGRSRSNPNIARDIEFATNGAVSRWTILYPDNEF
jgi:DNA-binding transcriptional regulator YdaS (Cro superfamily)